MNLSGYGLGYDIILQIGDSNSYAGINIDGTPSYDPAIDTVNPNCFEWRSANHNATPPGDAFFYSIVANSFHPFDFAPPGESVVSTAINGVGPGENFIKWWQTNQAGPVGRKTMIVVCGVGGTGLCGAGTPAWAATPTPGDDLKVAKDRTNLILSKDVNHRLVCILWTTGANDAILEKTSGLSVATYQNAFIATAAYLRTNITNATNVPILLQPLVPAFVTNPSTACPNTNTAISTMPSVVSQCGYADPTGFTVLGQTATVFHLCGDAQRLIGSTLFPNAYTNRSP